MRHPLLFSTLLSTSLLFSGTLELTGTIVSDNQKMIGARYMGYVKNIFFDIGDKVKREDTLFELESAEFDIMKNQATLALEQAEIMVDLYRDRLDGIRDRKIKFKKAGLNMELKDLDGMTDHVQAGLTAAQGLVENATEKVKQMATIANYLEVKAPNDGIIVQKGIRVGDLIVPGMLSMVLVDLDHLEIEAQLSEANLLKVDKGNKVNVYIPSLKLNTQGVVKSIVPAANPMTHTFTLRIKFNKNSDKIFPGMYTKITIEHNNKDFIVTTPMQSKKLIHTTPTVVQKQITPNPSTNHTEERNDKLLFK